MKRMSDKVFFDSNILIYAYSLDDLSKRQCVKTVADSHDVIIISTQTINEFVNVMTKKKKMSYQQIALVINEIYGNLEIEIIDKNIIDKAIDIAIKHSYSYFDSLMIASALANDCSILYTEDMHNQHIIENSLKLINPFKLVQ